MGDGYDSIFANLHHELQTSVLQGGVGFCGVTQEAYAINGVTYGWKPGSTISVGLDFDDLGQLKASQVKEAIEAAVNEIREVTDGLKFNLFTPPLQSNIKCVLARLDGKNGVLADCQIPSPNASPANTQLQMRIDTGEVWRLFTQQLNGAIDFYRVWLHEFLHGIGLGHKPASIASPALIAPMYSPIVRNLQDADKGEIVRRYGGRTTPIAPKPPATPARVVQAEINVTIDGQAWTAKGNLRPAQQLVSDYPTQVVRPIEQLEDWNGDTDLYEEGP